MTSALPVPPSTAMARSTPIPRRISRLQPACPPPETATAFTGTRLECDVAGNCATAGPIGPNMVDKKPPQITITAPAATNYVLNQGVASNYSCTDGGSGLATCAGPVAAGSNFATAAVGAKTFTV